MAIFFVFLVVFLLVGSCFLITLIKCLNDRSLKVFSKCICHCFCLCCCIFLVRSCFLISLINVLMVKGLKDRYLKVWCSLYVFVIVFVIVFVVVFLLTRLCFLMTRISCIGFAINMSDSEKCLCGNIESTSNHLLDFDHTHQSTTRSLHFRSG